MPVTRSNWGQLAGVATLLVLAIAGAAMLGAFGLYAATHELWDAPAGPPAWLELSAIAALAVCVVFPGLVVGRVARVRRWWLVVPVLFSVLCGLATGAAAAALSGDAGAAAGTLPGLIAGSLLGVALADRFGGSEPGVVTVGRSGRPRPVRARDGQVIAGVCAAIAHRQGSAAKEVRVLAVVVVVVLAVALPPLAPVPVILYLFAWLTWPEEPADTTARPAVEG